MRTRVRVARAEELPPGRGKLVSVSGRQIAVWNREGRLRAVAEGGTSCVGLGPHLPGHAAPCAVGGGFFDVAQPGSPADAFEGPELTVSIEGDAVLLLVEPGIAD